MSLADKLIDPFVKKWTEPAGQIMRIGGTQCVAVFNQQEQDIVGGGWIGTPITGYADDLWTEFGKDIDYANYITIKANERAQKGDSAIWFHYNGGKNKPHVALVLADLGDELRCLTQNPGAVHVEDLTKKGLAGYLRPKKFINTAVSREQIAAAYLEVLKRPFDEPGMQTYLNSGFSIDKIKSEMRSSPEYKQLKEREAKAATEATKRKAQKEAPKTHVANINHKNTNGTFTVNHSVPGYINSADAMAGQNSNSTVPVGTYAIFNEWNGAINVTRQRGVPGWWLNPKV